MSETEFSRNIRVDSLKKTIASIILVGNVIVWLSCSSNVLQGILSAGAFSDNARLVVWFVTFIVAVVSILSGASAANRSNSRIRFLLLWILFGMLASVTPILANPKDMVHVVIISFAFSASLGFGLSVCMAYLSEHTVVEKRGRIGGIILFLSMALAAFSSKFVQTENVFTSSLFLAILRGLSLVAFPLIKSDEKKTDEKSSVSYMSILRERPFVLYVIPWAMFALVNYLSVPIGVAIHSQEFIGLLTIIGNLLAGTFAIAGGVLSDIVGRKRVTIAGFVMLGLGYAILGIAPLNQLSWYFYIAVDGIAWGMLSVIFLTTLWGDLARERLSQKYWALGIIPFLLSNFLRLTLGPLIQNAISAYAIFSFAALFLFLAVLPLMYAPETLSERKIKGRELRLYLEKAKKVKDRFRSNRE